MAVLAGCAPGLSVVGGSARDASSGLDALDALDAPTDATDVPPMCRRDNECDDLVACTVDTCRAGRCEHAPSSALCPMGSACEINRGCRPARSCRDDMGCRDDDPCTLRERCRDDLHTCVFDELPADTPCGAQASGRACRGGACQCPADRTALCGDQCVDMGSDPVNCGRCGNACIAGSWCRAGACACPDSQVYCSAVGCVDTAVDLMNCGACGRACAPSASDGGVTRCITGRCVAPCSVDSHLCGAECVPNTSVATCGARCEPCPTDPRGAAGCVAGVCTLSCQSGHHLCGARCADNASVDSCGDACTPCPRPEHGTVACVAGACRASCETGYHACGGQCRSNAATDSCGASCVPCARPEHGVATCSAGACGFTCEAGYHRCGDACSDGTSPLGCGPTCTRCSVPAHGVATCTTGRCGYTCDPGFHACGEACLSDAAPASCGTRCTPCPPPPHGTATCSLGACGVTCDPGYLLSAGACIELPRLVAPASTSTSTSRRPRLRWTLPTDLAGVTVDLCADRSCGVVLASMASSSTSAVPAMDLPIGVVFWRVRTADPLRVSPTWEFVVGARSAAVATTWGALLDLDGDGRGEVAVGEPYRTTPGARVSLFGGSAIGRVATFEDPGAVEFGRSLASAGDVDGDGYGDLLVGASATARAGGRVYVIHGGAGRLTGSSAVTLEGPDGPESDFGVALAAAGDVNGDGYGDAIVGAPRARSEGRVYVFLGGSRGLGSAPSLTLAAPDGPDSHFGVSVDAAGDVNGDGYSDVIVGADGANHGAGRAYVFLGGSAGLGATPAGTFSRPDAVAFGRAVACAGDVNGDGYGDVIVGGPETASRAGGAWVYLGGATSPAAAVASPLGGPDGVDLEFGAALASAGDVNGDGFTDLMVGMPGILASAGRVRLYLGRADGPEASTALELGGFASAGDRFGASLGPGRDVDGDGFSDVPVGAERRFSGFVYVLRGDGTSFGPLTLLNDPTGTRFGASVALTDPHPWRRHRGPGHWRHPLLLRRGQVTR